MNQRVHPPSRPQAIDGSPEGQVPLALPRAGAARRAGERNASSRTRNAGTRGYMTRKGLWMNEAFLLLLFRKVRYTVDFVPKERPNPGYGNRDRQMQPVMQTLLGKQHYSRTLSLPANSGGNADAV